jgi:O-glycosyl hydrolase
MEKRSRGTGRQVWQALLVGGALAGLGLAWPAAAQTVTVDSSVRYQTIDGFGTFASAESGQAWWQSLFLDDLGASIMRMDLTPPFVGAPAAQDYCSPWFGESGSMSLDNNGNGPDGTRTRQYTSISDYSNTFGGCSAPIAVMGTDIDANAALLDLGTTGPLANAGHLAQLGQTRSADFKLYASLWSPSPWLKVSSGNSFGGDSWPGPTAGVKWPFIWGGNFAGGKLDVSGTALSQLGNTSALTQFARTLAAFLHGFQQTYGVHFYAISIQNELNFEEYYNSATYPQASMYVAALKAARAELDSHADLKAIRIFGPEDLLGGDAWGLWELGSGASSVQKNLQYLQAVGADQTAAAALAGFAVHGYAPDGVSAAGASATQWTRWASGWTTSPAQGLPANVAGFTSFGKSSWMTETSGETGGWLDSSAGTGGFPDTGGFSIAVKLHQALTSGQESAWIYWQLTDGSPSLPSNQALTDSTSLATAPKYVAAKHFFRAIRPGARRVSAAVTGASTLLASAYVLDAAGSLTVVLINEAATAATVQLALGSAPAGLSSLSAFTSSQGRSWQASTVPVTGGSASVSVPGYGVVTLTGTGTATDGGTGPSDAGSGTVDAGSHLPDAGSHPPDAGSGSVDAGPGPGADGGAGGDGGSEEPPLGGAVQGSCGCGAGGGLGAALWAGLLVAARARRRKADPRAQRASTQR